MHGDHAGRQELLLWPNRTCPCAYHTCRQTTILRPYLHDPVEFIHALSVLSHAAVLGHFPAMAHGPQHPAQLYAVGPPVGHAYHITAAICCRLNGSATQARL